MSFERPPILLVGDTLAVGGTERQFTEIARGLSHAGWQIHVACLRAEGPLRARLEEVGIHPWSCGEGSLKSPVFLRGIWRLARYMRRHRIGLVHSFDFYSNLYGVLAGRLARTRIVMASQRDLGDLRAPVQQRINRMMLRLAGRVLVNSEAAAARVREGDGVRPERVFVVRNGIDMSRFRPRELNGDAPRVRVFGTVANLRPEKGLSDFVRATALVRSQHPDVRVVIWGEGPLRPQLEDLVRNLSLHHVVELPGHAEDAEKAMSAMSAFVLPSLSESCSNSLMEAMTKGLPVIASNTGGNPELVVEGSSGLLVRPGDPADLARAMAYMMENPATAASLAAQAAQRARVEFSLPGMLAEVQAVYILALSGGASSTLATPGRAA
jgi:glycosyltransferase involved in cell wall biosynthesis